MSSVAASRTSAPSSTPQPPGAQGLGATLGRGALAGLAGTTVMTAFQRFVEMPLTGRRESYAPAALVTKLLPIKRKRRRDRRLNYATHFAIGLGWGAAHSVVARAGLSGQSAVAVAFGVLYPGDVILNTALGLDAPQRWSARDLAIDVADKLVLAEATGLVYDRLARGTAS